MTSIDMMENVPLVQAVEEFAIEVSDLQKSFNGEPVLNGISFKVKTGENLAVLGRSGSGKSVLIKCLVGLIEPDEGTMKLLGKEMDQISKKELNQIRKKVGFLFQNAALYESMSVRENMLFPLRDDTSLSVSEKLNLAEAGLKAVGLEGTIEKMPSALSGGMRKRLGLARTVLLKPSIMLYDEPTTGLDPITSKEISELILAIRKQHHTASIIITHDIACVKLTADRIILLKEGKIEAEGDFETLSNSKNKWVRSFFE